MRPFACPRSGHVEDGNLLAFDKSSGFVGGLGVVCVSCIDYQNRLRLCDTVVPGLTRATFQFAVEKNDGTVAVDDIFHCAFAVSTLLELGQGVAGGNRAVLRQSRRRGPTPAWKSCFKSGIERAAIDAGLATRDNLAQWHNSVTGAP